MTLKNAYAKGYRLENWLVKALQGLGLTARRQPLSGAYGTSVGAEDLRGDVVFHVGPERFSVECKSRSTGGGFVQLEKWIAGHDCLVLKRDRQQPMVVLTWDAFSKMAQSGIQFRGRE